MSHICSVIPSWKTQYYDGRYDIEFDIKNGIDVIIDTFGWKGYKMFIPFNDTKLNALPSSFDYNPDYAKDYINNTSIIHYFPAMIVYWLYSENDKSIVVDEKIINNFINTDNDKSVTPNSNLIIILVESLESWSLEQGDLSKQAANNFLDFIGQDHILYCNSVRSQAKHGVSGDGQMIVNTGLLPIYAGAACMRFGDNTYPNIASNFNHSLLVDISDGIWNQRQMTFKYGYKNEYFREGGLSEPEMFHNMLNALDTIAEPYCMMGITISMHSPFDRYNTKHLSLPEHTPYWLGEYMECLYFTDSCFGKFWNKIKNTEILQNSTIVITGDHTVFKRNMLQDFSKFSPNVPSEESYTPLIIYSPKINGNIKISDTCYQMDIYPTIMHLIGCEEYYWKGFGVNLLDSTAMRNRIISEQDAYELSDKLIRSNYFSTDYQKRDDQNYIAHAGGCIDGFKYTNSLEAVNNAIRLNFKYVELDFELTSDSQLVATHGWGNWEYTPTYKEFMAKKIYDRFTPLDAYRIDSILLANPDLNLVTDRISDPVIIDKHFNKYRERIWIECFTDEDYFTLQKLGYNVLRSDWPPTNAETRNHLLKHFSFRDFKIKNYTFAGFGGNYKKSHGDCFAIFGDANIHIKDADKQFANDKRIKFVYVDFLE